MTPGGWTESVVVRALIGAIVGTIIGASLGALSSRRSPGRRAALLAVVLGALLAGLAPKLTSVLTPGADSNAPPAARCRMLRYVYQKLEAVPDEHRATLVRAVQTHRLGAAPSKRAAGPSANPQPERQSDPSRPR